MDKVLKNFGVETPRGHPYNPQANGGVEAANKTLKERLKALLSEFGENGQDSWGQFLPFVMQSMNAAPMKRRRYMSAHEALMGVAPSLPAHSRLKDEMKKKVQEAMSAVVTATAELINVESEEEQEVLNYEMQKDKMAKMQAENEMLKQQVSRLQQQGNDVPRF